MNDEITKQNSQGNIYQGNYDNDYKESIKAVSDFSSGGNLSSHHSFEGSFETPKYMNLGAPRERDEEDHAHHEHSMRSFFNDSSFINLSSLGFTSKKKEGFMVPPKRGGTISRFFARYFNLYFHGPHFKLTKTSIVSQTSISSKIKWGIMIVFLSVSVSSFLTQSALFLKERLFDGKNIAVSTFFFSQNNGDTNVATNDLATNTASNPVDASGRPAGEVFGSDDGTTVNGSSTSLKIGGVAQYRLNDITHFPVLSAKSFLVADLVTGEMIKESQDVGVYPLASVSKLMTGLIAYEKMDQRSMAIVSRRSYNTFGTQGELLLGEAIRVSDLMYPLLMESSNDGAEVLADAYGHDKFMSDMNKKATALGMHDTYYNDPSGLDPKNVSTVSDQFKLAKYIYENAPVIFDLTRVRQFEILNHRWYSKNAMLNLDSFIGGKNGFIDESRQTTVSLFDIQMAKGGKRKIAIVLLRTNDREGDTIKLVNFLKKNGYYELSTAN